MRQFNRILGFVAVGFVLLFMGRVNKTSLYTAYFRTIADVEIRNSQALDQSDAHFVVPSTKASGHKHINLSPQGHPSFAAKDIEALVFVLDNSNLNTNFPHSNAIGMRCFLEIAPRAPGV